MQASAEQAGAKTNMGAGRNAKGSLFALNLGGCSLDELAELVNWANVRDFKKPNLSPCVLIESDDAGSDASRLDATAASVEAIAETSETNTSTEAVKSEQANGPEPNGGADSTVADETEQAVHETDSLEAAAQAEEALDAVEELIHEDAQAELGNADDAEAQLASEPETVSSEQVSSEQVSSEQVSSEQVSPETVSPQAAVNVEPSTTHSAAEESLHAEDAELPISGTAGSGADLTNDEPAAAEIHSATTVAPEKPVAALSQPALKASQPPAAASRPIREPSAPRNTEIQRAVPVRRTIAMPSSVASPTAHDESYLRRLESLVLDLNLQLGQKENASLNSAADYTAWLQQRVIELNLQNLALQEELAKHQ